MACQITYYAGKPTCIIIFTFLAVSLGLCKLPADMNWKTIIGIGFLAGIGFTMSIFITLLAFGNDVIINNAKLMILLSSLVAGTIGFIVLKSKLKTIQKPNTAL